MRTTFTNEDIGAARAEYDDIAIARKREKLLQMRYCVRGELFESGQTCLRMNWEPQVLERDPVTGTRFLGTCPRSVL